MFRKKIRTPLNKATSIPSGLVVHTENGYFFLKGIVRYKVYNERALLSWNFPHITEARESAVQQYPVAGKLGFRDGTVLRNFSNGQTYLISESKARHITSPDFLNDLGIHDVIHVSEKEIKLHKVGEDID